MKEITKKYKNFLFKLKKIDLDIEIDSKKSLDYLFNYYGTDKGSDVINPYSKESNEKMGHGFGKVLRKEI